MESTISTPVSDGERLATLSARWVTGNHQYKNKQLHFNKHCVALISHGLMLIAFEVRERNPEFVLGVLCINKGGILRLHFRRRLLGVHLSKVC